MNNLAALQAELAKPQYSTMTDAQAMAVLNAPSAQPCSCFGSFRTLANLLTAAEYNALRAALNAAASASALLTDMIAMLALPGDEAGNGGGLDFGSAVLQSMVNQLCQGSTALTAVPGKIAAYATLQTSWARQNGFGLVNVWQVAQAREHATP
ncbi:MAG: hypothetical protein ABSF26_19705 [Thermoguttaceae bacterium]|jgi:hypothetical protein